jgi:hypothetical protein
LTGLPSLSRSSSGVFISGNPPLPIALPLIRAAVCYANCDASTVAPILSASDFIAFSTATRRGIRTPTAMCRRLRRVLNVGDFTCFINKYAAGCP